MTEETETKELGTERIETGLQPDRGEVRESNRPYPDGNNRIGRDTGIRLN